MYDSPSWFVVRGHKILLRNTLTEDLVRLIELRSEPGGAFVDNRQWDQLFIHVEIEPRIECRLTKEISEVLCRGGLV